VNVEAFRVLAERYCAFIESFDALKRGEFVWQLAEHLIGLYATGAKLPSGGGDDDFDAPSVVTTEEWWELFQRLGRKLGDVECYAVMFDPYESDSKPVMGSLADDAADVYRELKDGLGVIASGGGIENAVWAWRFGFDSHWGKHAAEALYALHSLTYPGSVKWVGRDE
jgi:Domain of unknown function (DUF5063)